MGVWGFAVKSQIYVQCTQKENIVAVADVYNINVTQVLPFINSSLKDLFWEHFIKAVKPSINCSVYSVSVLMCILCILLIRPPGTVVLDGLMFYP